jgi:hypothetical protein
MFGDLLRGEYGLHSLMLIDNEMGDLWIVSARYISIALFEGGGEGP